MSRKIRSYAVDANQLSWAEFSTKHDYHVLVIVPADEDAPTPIDTHECLNDMLDGRPSIDENYRVGLVRKRVERNPFQCFVTIGRADNNDIRLADIEVSKVHAYFEKEGDEHWTLRDGGSTNGTFINGRLIDPDRKIVLRSSDALKFSRTVSAVYFSPGDFFNFLRSPEVRSALLT